MALQFPPTNTADPLPVQPSIQAASFTIEWNKHYFIDSSSVVPVVISLPVTPPANGSRVKFTDATLTAATNPIVILTNLMKLYGAADDYLINRDGATVTLNYVNSTIGLVAEGF